MNTPTDDTLFRNAYDRLLAALPHNQQAEVMAFPTGALATELAANAVLMSEVTP